MNKEFFQKLSKRTISQEELNTFIIEYVKSEKGFEPTSKQLQEISIAIQRGQFDLMFAAKRAAEKLNFQIVDIFSKEGIYITTYFYEQ